MKAIIFVGEQMSVEVEGVDTKELFRQIGQLQEVFGNTVCGLCGGKAVPSFRMAQEFSYYEMRCTNSKGCGARLAMGQAKKANQLFPTRKLTPTGKPDWQNGAEGFHGGWTKYRGDLEGVNDSAASAERGDAYEGQVEQHGAPTPTITHHPAAEITPPNNAPVKRPITDYTAIEIRDGLIKKELQLVNAGQCARGALVAIAFAAIGGFKDPMTPIQKKAVSDAAASYIKSRTKGK